MSVENNPLLTNLMQIAEGIALQFGKDCEVIIHDLTKENVDHSIIFIRNGHVSGRKLGDGPSKVVWETLQNQNKKKEEKDHIGYLTRTANGKVLKSATMYIHDKNDTLSYLLSINYDITALLAMESAINSFTVPQVTQEKHVPEPIISNVNDLLDSLIDQSVALVGKPVAFMGKEEKVRAIQFLNDSGAFLITKSGDKVASFFGISKYTLYSYIDTKKQS